LNTDPDVKAYIAVFRRQPDDNVVVAATAILIAVGLIICAVAAIGLYGGMKEIKVLIGIYIMCLVVIMVLELVAGFLVVVFKDDIHLYVKDGMRGQIKERYEWDNYEGYAWNRVQVRNRCCGADGSWDYQDSQWYYSMNPGAETSEDAEFHVPKSCCKLEMNQDRDVGRVDPQNPQPKDEKRCQEDAAGRKDGSDYLNGRGCFAALMDFIYIHINLILGLGIAAGLFQLFGLGCAVYVFMRMRDNY
jgi:tetraspanin-18